MTSNIYVMLFANSFYNSSCIYFLIRIYSTFYYACNRFGMASDTQGSMDLKQQPPARIQIYSTPSNEITPFWRGLYPYLLTLSLLTNAFLIARMLVQNLVRTDLWLNMSFNVAEKYEREAKKYWDNFYKRHQDRVRPHAL